jgi:peptide/nickel transport system substrate-binding protein
LTGRAAEKLRLNPRKSWWNNVPEVAVDGPAEATFVLKRPQPAILALIASGYTPVYPCHVAPREMRQHPIGTGPFKFVEFKPNEGIKLARNPDYWKPGRLISTASNTRSSPTARPRSSPSPPASST